MKRRWVRYSVMMLATALAALGCERSNPVKTVESMEPTTQPAPKSAIETGDPLAPIRKRAEAGEVNAMITLGRMYESLGGADSLAKARQWYEKAAATGSEDAQRALKLMELTSGNSAVASATSADPRTLAATKPATAPAGFSMLPSSPATSQAAGTLSWKELMESSDTTGFESSTRPAYQMKDNSVRFIGLTRPSDNSITIAASGPTGDDITEVSIVLRVRNQQTLANNVRVLQAGTLCKAITRQNMDQDDLIKWIGDYLSSGKKSDPTYRGGWKITVSGTSAEGIRDPKQFMGEAVLIEMKK